MDKSSLMLCALLALPAALRAGDAPATEAKPATETKPAESARHPLKGVVVEVRASRHALLVKHEAIPGYMMAMTMQFRADEATLRFVRAGDTISGALVRRGDDFWIEDVKVVKP